jgi:hypothetical protein
MGNYYTDSQTALTDNRLVQYSDPVELLFSDGTDAIATCNRKLICTVPAYSIILRVMYLKLVSFNAGGNDYLTVGSYADDDLLVDDADIATAAATIPIWVMTTTLPYYVSADTPIYASYVYSSTAPTTGQVQVAIEWVPWTVDSNATVVIGT